MIDPLTLGLIVLAIVATTFLTVRFMSVQSIHRQYPYCPTCGKKLCPVCHDKRCSPGWEYGKNYGI